MKKVIQISLLVLLVSFTIQAQDLVDTRYEVKITEFNSGVSDFGPAYFGDDGLIFASERDTGNVNKRRHYIKGKLRPFLQLFSVKNDSANTVSRLKNIVNKKFHESTVAITNDGSTMYFTRNNYFNGAFKTDENDMNLLKIFRATKSGDEWVNIVELPFNSDDYSVAHPALSTDNNRLYFASDMPGTFGKSDIFYVDITGDNEYSTPINMGKIINTYGQDTFPFITKKGDLYFASDKHENNLGGLDLFVAPIDENYTTVYNLGAPMNTEKDDFALIFNEEDRTGYFSSNRPGVGDDDIYKFKELSPLEKRYLVEGIVINEDTEELIPNALVELKDEDGNVVATAITDENGSYKIKYSSEEHLQIVPTKDDLVFTNKEVPFQKNGIVNFVIGEDIDTPVVAAQAAGIGYPSVNGEVDFLIGPIYFDFNKYSITPRAALRLNIVERLMRKYPNMVIEIKSYTDSRATNSYNVTLSENRARMTAAYLIAKGIAPNRLVKNHFGETGLVNDCGDDKHCQEALHDLNRRSEFIILSK